MIEPCAFPLSDKSAKRAALDYGPLADITRHDSWEAFMVSPARREGRLVLFTTKGAGPLHDFIFEPRDTLLMGRESAGAPDEVHAAADARLFIPLRPEARSLNVIAAARNWSWRGAAADRRFSRRRDGLIVMPTHTIRRALQEEGATIARLYRRTAGREWPFLAPHTSAEDIAFFLRSFDIGAVWAAEQDGEIVGFCAVRRGWIDHLFVAHERHGQGIGQALLRQALKGRFRVRLWTFQRNVRARAFYTRWGFRELRFTDGAHNEEREPDVMLEWALPPRLPV